MERERIDARIQELQTERTSILGLTTRLDHDNPRAASAPLKNIIAIPHIMRLLTEKKAHSRSQSVDREWLDQQLVNKVEGIKHGQAVSFGLIELKERGKIDYEGKNPIKKIWLI